MAINCPICDRDFSLFRWRHECTECGETVCHDCLRYSRCLNREICTNCSKDLNDALSSIKTVVKSDHVGEHIITKSYKTIKGTNWERDMQDSVNNIKYQTHKLGANAIVSLKIQRGTGSERGTGRGTHHYSVFVASGKPVIIEKKKYVKKRTKGNTNIAVEIEKLVRLKEKGHITEEEFQKAKAKLIK